LTTHSVPSWRNLSLIVAGAALLLVVIYSGTAGSLWSAWSNDPLGHGYVVVPAALYLVWMRRDDVRSVPARPAFWLLPVLGVLGSLWLLGNLASSKTVQQLCLVLMFVGLVWGTVGTAVARILMLPLGLLIFALPVGDLFVPALQGVTARTAISGLHATGIPAHLDSTVITVPGTSWDVARACSGINYLMSSLVIAYLYAGLVYRSWLNRVVLLAMAVPLALFANALRVYVTILAASLGANGVASGLKHDAMGWIVFAVIMWAMFAASRLLLERTSPAPPSRLLPVAGCSPVADFSRQTLAFVGLALLVLSVAPLSARQIWLASETVASIQPRLFDVSPPWEATDGGPDRQLTGFPRPSGDGVRMYRRGEQMVRLDVVSFNGPDVRERMSAQSIDDPTIAIDRRDSFRSRPITLHAQSFDVQEVIVEAAGLSTIEWTWYSVDGVLTSGRYRSRLLLAKSRLLSTGSGSAAFRLTSRQKTADRAVATLEDFVAHVALKGI
jgi:exosortase A